jgi:hypothetical protein
VFRIARVLQVTCVITCLVTVPLTDAFASERAAASTEAVPPVAEGIMNGIRRASFGAPAANADFTPVPTQFAMQSRGRVSVADTNESKLLLGIAAGTMVVAGLGLIAYGATSTCKGINGDPTTTNGCDKKTMMGALSLSGGLATFLVWSFSRE